MCIALGLLLFTQAVLRHKADVLADMMIQKFRHPGKDVSARERARMAPTAAECRRALLRHLPV